MEANLHAVIKWCTNNRLTLNISKTKHMIVGHAPGDNIVVNKCLQYNQQQIEIVSDYSYLGVELDNNLTMEKQINKSVNKANKKLFMIGKLRKCLSNRTTALLYKQLVRPHLEYCDFLVDSSLKKHIKKFDKVQHRALRTINYGQREHRSYAETMALYDIQNLHVRRKEHLLLQMFVNKDNVEYIDAYRPDMLLRNYNGTKFKIKTTRNHRVHISPYYRGVYLWERLPNITRELQCKKEFKQCIKNCRTVQM